MDINRGDRFEYLVSMSSRALSLNEYARRYYGPKNYYASVKMKQGDYNATLIRTIKGKVFNLTFDTNTPHPRGTYRLQGTKAAYMRNPAFGEKLYLDRELHKVDGHEWEDADKYFEQYEHPLLKEYNPPERPLIRGHSGGGRRTPFYWHRLVQALRESRVTDFDVYDSVTSSAIIPLTEKSVAEGSKLIEFPDFTRGKWRDRAGLVDD